MRGADTLTEREGAILRLVADGLSNRDIAARLALSVNTVKWYVQQVYQKLGVRRRTQAVVLLRQSDEQAAPDLPAPLTPLVGREHERAEVLALLQSSSTTRLVSLVGAGGIGKTRLAQAIAATWRDEQPDEVCWVSLDGLAAPDQIIPAIGATLGFQFGDRADLRSQLMAGLRHRHLLLVLDNFEHLLDAAPLVSDLLAAAPGLRVLATSRERLNLRGEVVYRLDGLAFPQLAEDLQQFSAVQLFVQVARRARPAYDPSPLDVGYIARICGLAEGMPLAIELAAAWTDVLEPCDIAREIEAGIAILKTDARDVPARHRSVQAAFEHSWQLLSPDEQAVFGRLAVFRGGFDRRAAEAVAGASLFGLSTLVDKSLVMRVGPDRYKLHELLRQFADDKLKADESQYVQTLDQHCHHYGTLLCELEATTKASAAQVASVHLALLRPNHDNILAGWRRAIGYPLLDEIGRYVYGVDLFFISFGLFTLGEETLRRALRQFDAHPGAVSPLDRMRVLTYLGWFCNTTSKYDDGRRVLEEALELSRSAARIMESDPHTVGLLLMFLGWAATKTGDGQIARQHVTDALALCRSLNFEFGIWPCLATLGEIEFVSGNYEAARAIHDESVDLARRYNYVIGLLYGLSTLACDCCALGETTLARSLLHEALELNRSIQLIDPILLAALGVAMLAGHRVGRLADLEQLAILYHHPQFGGMARYKAEHLLEQMRVQFPPAQVEAVLDRASKRQLSTPLLEPDFIIDAAFIDRLLLALDQLPQP